MPVLKIIANLSRDKIPADFFTMATEFLAKLLEKDKKVSLQHPSHLHSLHTNRNGFNVWFWYNIYRYASRPTHLQITIDFIVHPKPSFIIIILKFTY